MIDGTGGQRYVLLWLRALLKKGFSTMSKICCILFLGLATLSFNAMGETYKCRSPDGKVSYAGQISLTPGVKCEQIFVKKQAVVVQEAPPAAGPETVPPAETDPRTAPPPEAAVPPPAATPQKADTAKKKSEKATQEKSASDKQAEQKMKEDNCQSAKANLRTYQVGGRISKVNENGEKAYLDDAEIKQKTQDAQKEVDKWCS